MMPKISNGSTFGGIVNYANDIKDKDTTILASRGVDLTNNYTITQSFKVQAMMNRRVEKCVGHFALSFPPEDAHRCTDSFMRKLAMEYMKKMGITDTQFVIFRHHDHDHQHVHVVYNRVNDYGKTISDGCDVERAIAICQAMTRHYGLHWGEGKKNVNRSRLKGKAATKYAIYDAAQKALAGSQTWADFKKLMKEQGIEVKLVYRGKDKGMGVVFTKGNITMSGSQVDRHSLTFGMLYMQLCNVNNVLPKDQQLPYDHVRLDDELADNVRLPQISFGKSDEIAEDNSVDLFENNDGSSVIDVNEIAETATDVVGSVASAAVDIMMGPDVVPSAGGGGGGSSKKDDDEDEDEKKKKRRSAFHR